MKTASRFALTLALVLALLSLGSLAMAQGAAKARFVNIAPGAPTLDIYVNGQLAVAELAPGAASPYINLPAGDASMAANSAGASSPLYEQTATLSAGTATAFVASSVADSGFIQAGENLGALGMGKGRLLILYALTDGPAVDIVARENAQRLGESFEPGMALGEYVLDATVIDLALLPAGGELETSLFDFSVGVAAGLSQIAIIHGSAGNPQLLLTRAAVAGDDNAGLARFVHALPGATPMDLTIDGALTIPGLAYARPSEHIALPAGAYEIGLSIGGAEIVSQSIEVEAGRAQTVVAMGTAADLMLSSYADDLSGIDMATAKASLINAIPASVIDGLMIAGGAAAFNVAYGDASGAVTIASGPQSLSLNLQIGDASGSVSLPESTFYGGAYYNMIALPGDAFSSPSLLIAETAIARGIGADAPESEGMTIEAALEQEGAELVRVEMQELTPAVVRIGARDGATAVVDLNPGANLQLREYPDRNSRSMGLAPAGTRLIVVGRRGLTEYYGAEPADEPVDLSGYDADPAEGLRWHEDLVAADTWLFVTYMTPDGGSINAWASALYLDVVDAAGDPQQLKRLDMVRQNEAGSASNTAIGPAQPINRVSALVQGLNPEAMLNIRMANDPNSENLGQIAVGTALGLLGLDEAEEWAFIQHSLEDGVTISGWVSRQYIGIQYDGRPFSLERLRGMNPQHVPIIPDARRGGIETAVGADRPDAPTKDPFLGVVAGTVTVQQGANLHLRVGPDANTESLALIPSGAMVIVDGVTENREWLNIRHDDQAGWAAAAFLSLSFNNVALPRDELENRLQQHDNRGYPFAVAG